MSDYFPPDVLTKILLRLPVKSLVRFTLVSKTWQAFITSEEFISMHLSSVQYDPTMDSLIVRYYSELDAKEHYELRPDDSCFLSKSTEIKFRLKSREGFNQIVGSCNGIICLCDNLFGNFSTSPIVLWNPSIQKDTVLPLPVIEPSSKCFVLGFGYDVQRDDYKVVRILYRQGFIRKPIEADVFSLRKKRWGPVKDVVFKGYINDIGQSQVYFNGAVYWMAYEEMGNGDLQNSILGFDCSDEEFIETVLPDGLADVELNPNLHITAHEGSLAMISYNASSCRIWVMKEYYGYADSWTPLYFFEWTQLYELPLGRGMAKVVGFRNTGELLVTLRVEDDRNVSYGGPFRPAFRPASGELISYNPKTLEISKHPQVPGWIDSFRVLDHVETLSLLDYSSIYPKTEVGNANSFQEVVYRDPLMGEENHDFCKFNDDDDEDENNGGDFYMGEVNVDDDNEAANDEFVPMEEFGESYKDVNYDGDACMGVGNEAEDDIFPMEEEDDSWILVPRLKDLQLKETKTD